MGAYLFGDFFHVMTDEVIALGVEQDGEAPRVLKGDEVGFAGVEVKMQDLEEANLLLSHLRALKAFSQLAGWHWERVSGMTELNSARIDAHVVHIRNEPLYLRRSKSAMMQSTMCGFGVRKYTASVSGWF